MAPFEALYGRRCRFPVCWDDVGEKKLLRPELVQLTVEKVSLIKERLKAAQSRQKSYVDNCIWDLEYHPLKKVKELNRKKDIVCLILSYPPMNSANKERHKNWVRDVLKINHKVREMETFSSRKNTSFSELTSEITTLLDHSLDDIEAYVPPIIIEKMCEKTLQVTEPDEKLRNLAVNFATRQILEEIENPEVRRIRISGRDGIRVTSAVKDLPQIRKRFNIVIQVDASSYPNIKGIEENIATQLGFSLDIWVLNRVLKNTSFLIFLDDPYERIDLYEVGRKWWNSKNIQKIVCSTSCSTRSQEVHQRMALDRQIRLEDHLLSWELFCLNVGKIVHSSGFQHRAIDVVQKCSGHLLAVALMARALKMVFDVSIWEHASYILSLPHRSQWKDRVLYNALAFILGRSGSADKCVNYCAFYMEREGVDKVDLIQEWIRHALISTFDEGEKIVQDLVSAFLLESFQNGYFVQMRDEIREVLVNSQFLLQGGKGLTKAPKDDAWEEASEIHLMNNKLSELPKIPNCPQLCALFLQKNPSLRVIPPLFFQRMPILQILDLSHTKIRSLPQSLYGLAQLQRLFLRGCKLFMELPPEVGKLSNLKVLDLEGTEIIRLPVDVGKLTNLTCLKMSFCGDNDNRKDNQYSNRIIPQGVKSNLFHLKELIIDVNPNDKRWNANVEEIVEEVCNLDRLEALQLYFPEVLLLNNLMDGSSINLPGMHFRFTVGSHLKPIISRLPLEAIAKFEEEERCLKYVNGKGVPTKIEEVLELATALFLDRHSTATSLSEFGIENMRNLKVCVLGECDEIQTITDADEDDDGAVHLEGATWMAFSITSKSFGAAYMPPIDYHFYLE
ncbi:probable disease resistance protein At4g27220 [Vitis riparia]|uniref:probable disease resistance protein At4g27220 n=1 Tax=Vitis riparia TaxID=96939 RepID=UPI00155B24E3|nr:probable disease resistance protein At4g27220 [Vitis riparia]